MTFPSVSVDVHRFFLHILHYLCNAQRVQKLFKRAGKICLTKHIHHCQSRQIGFKTTFNRHTTLLFLYIYGKIVMNRSNTSERDTTYRFVWGEKNHTLLEQISYFCHVHFPRVKLNQK